MTRPRRGKRQTSAQKAASIEKKEMKHILWLLDLIGSLFEGDETHIKLPFKWIVPLGASCLFKTLEMNDEMFFINENIDTDLIESFRSIKGLSVCLLPKRLRTNIELIYLYKQMLKCLYKIITMNHLGENFESLLVDFKNLLIAYVVESIECTCGYDEDNVDQLLMLFKDHFWFTFDTQLGTHNDSTTPTITSDSNLNLKTNRKTLIDNDNKQFERMRLYAEEKCKGDHERFLYGVVLCKGTLSLTVNPYCKASCPVFNVDLNKLVNPNQIIPIINKMLMMVELARKQMFQEQPIFL